MSWTNSFQFQNRVKRLHRCVQITLAVVFIVALNYVSMHHFHRIDLSLHNPYSLTPETRAYLENLRQSVNIIVTVPESSAREDDRRLLRHLDNLLREYSYHSRGDDGPLVQVEKVDVFKNQRRAEDLQREFGIVPANAIIVHSDNRHRFIHADDLITRDPAGNHVFKGERTFTSAILEVIQDQTAKAYFLVGHGEMSPEDPSPQRGLSELSVEMRARNLSVEKLDLTMVTDVPADANVVIIGDPQGPILGSELQKLRRFMNERAGRILIWMGPGTNHGLEPLLRDWGIRADDMLVLEQGSDFIEGTGRTLIRQFAEHPVTQPLIDTQTFVVSGLMRPVRPDLTVPYDDRLQATALMGSSHRSFAQKMTRIPSATGTTGSGSRFNPDQDLPGPVPIAAAAERRSATQLGINIPGGRIVVFGSRDLFANQQVAALGNNRLFFQSLNWLLDRDQQLAIPPRTMERHQITASRSELRRIALWFTSPAAAVALIGLIIVWIRKL